jgi:two-component system OmpR family response regulator
MTGSRPAGGRRPITCRNPYAFSELLARVEVLARGAAGQRRRRPPTGSPTSSSTGLSRKVQRGGEAIVLQPREFRLLEYLMKNAGTVVTRTMLLEKVWGLPFRSADQRHRRAHVPAPGQDRQGFSKPLLHTVRGLRLL